MQPPPSKKAKRRVSDAHRQRVSVSCDRCKTRKIRCIRIPGNGDACAACAQLSLACESTLPRKQRIYASYDQLQLRYRLLDTLIKKLYPDENVDSIEGIRSLARSHGLDMSGFEMEGAGDNIPIQEAESSTSGSQAGTLSLEDANLFASVHRLHIPEGALIPAPRGGYHYVGPASSYQFANTIRYLVKKFGTHTPPLDRPGYRRQQRAHEFTSAARTTALEARIPGHPVMAAELEETSPSIRDTFNPACRSETETNPSPQDRITPRSVQGSTSLGDHNDFLPPRRLADRLVDSFFDRVHLNFQLFDRNTFRVQYESLWSPPHSLPGSNISESGWACVLYMVFVLGAQSMERDNLPEAAAIQRRYLTIVVREGLQRVVLTATLANVHALALLGLYQHNAGERNTAWMLLGHASRMAIALGIQRDGETANFDYITRNTRRTTWWTLNLFEQSLSFILGRPSATSTIDVSARYPDEDFSNGGDTPHGFLQYAVKLGDISAQIKRFVASNSTHFASPNRLAETTGMASQLDQVLSRWEQSLPLHLQSCASFATSRHRRSVHLLHATYNHLRSVLGRPYLLCYVDHELDYQSTPLPDSSNTLPSAISSLAQTSLVGTRKCLSLLADLANHDCLEGELWYDYYYIHHASLILSLPLLIDSSNPRHASDRGLVSTALNLAKQSRLAPTYRILINVSIQFADIVGIGPSDDPSRPPSPRRGCEATIDDFNQITNDHGRISDLITDWTLGLENTMPGATYASAAHAAAVDATGISSGPSDPQAAGVLSSQNFAQANNHHDPSGGSRFASDSAANTWSLLPILSNVSGIQHVSLEQLLSMQSSSLLPENNTNPDQQHDEALFTDMFNFGYEAPASSAQSRRPSGLVGGDQIGSGLTEVSGVDSGLVTSGLDPGDFSWDFFGSGLSTNYASDRRTDGLDAPDGFDQWRWNA
jgi:proline utilization trans-activator